VDLILAVGDQAITAAQSVTLDIPIVMLARAAVITGFVKSLAKPMRNTTGVTCLSVELAARRANCR